jgi:hypothetical protein
MLDIGCGEGELLAVLCNPALYLDDPAHLSENSNGEAMHIVQAASEDFINLHLERIAGLDISKYDLEQAAEATAPRPDVDSSLPHLTPRWEDLEVKIWQGGLEHINTSFIGYDCIVSTEVFVSLSSLMHISSLRSL